MNDHLDGRGVARKHRNPKDAHLPLRLEMQQVEIERRSKLRPGLWTTVAERYRTVAQKFADQGNLDAAWAAFKAADRELLHGYADNEIKEEAVRVRLEAESKLSDWRQKFVLNVIPPLDDDSPPRRDRAAPSVDALKEYRRVLDDALDTRYRKLSLLRHRLKWSALGLIATLLITVGAWLGAISTGLSLGNVPRLLSDWRSVLAVLSLGALGASLSGLLSLRDQKLNARLPDLREGWTLLVWRPVVGAASAFVLVLFLQSGVGGLALYSSAALVAAVVAGFSEQAVSSAVGKASSILEQR